MLARKNVEAIINEIIAKLNEYLNHFNYHILTNQELNNGHFASSGGGKVRYAYACYAACDNGKYVAFKFEHANLAIHRIANIYNIRHALKNHLDGIREEKQEALEKRLDVIHQLLETGLMDNRKLSNDYGVSHITYKDGRLAGHGIFASWCNSTWTQSRAGRVLEKSLSILENFKIKFGQVTTPTPTAPPAYAVSVQTKSL